MQDPHSASDSSAAVDQPVWWQKAKMTAFVEVPLAAGQPYRSIEIQQIHHDGSSGLLVATHRPSGELDVTFSPELDLDESWFRHDPFLSHMPFGSLAPGDFARTRYEVNPRQVDVDVEVVDGSGTTIRVEMNHQFVRSSQPWFVPAVRQDQPTMLRFMSADYIRLLPRWAKHLRATADGVALTPRPFLLPASIAPFYLARFSGGVFGVGLNHPSDQPAESETQLADEVTVSDGQHHFTAKLHGRAQGARSGELEVHSSLGLVATGRWSVDSEGLIAPVELNNVAQQWFPGWRHPTRLALYGLRRVRRRNESWRWLPEPNQSPPTRSGRWTTSVSP